MKKSLLALAVLGAFAGAASAQTNVTIYGIVDAAITRTDTSATSANWSLDSSGQYNRNGSRIGFRGTEDLGGGLSAIFTLENGFGADNGTLQQGGRLFGRQAFVGLQGGFGAVKLGRQYTPMHNALDSVDPFNTGFAGNVENLFSGAGIRMDNTINYSLSAGGFSGQVAYGFGEVAGDNSASRNIGLGLGYTNGPINVQFAHQNTNNATDTGETKVSMLGGTYDFRVVKAHLAVQQDETELGTATTAKDRNWMVGVSAPVGAAGLVMASFVRSDDRLASNVDADQYAVGYLHNLSKRTNVYTSFARVNAKPAGSVDSNVFNVGLQHRF